MILKNYTCGGGSAPESIQRKDCDLNNLLGLPPFRLCLFCYRKNKSEKFKRALIFKCVTNWYCGIFDYLSQEVWWTSHLIGIWGKVRYCLLNCVLNFISLLLLRVRHLEFHQNLNLAKFILVKFTFLPSLTLPRCRISASFLLYPK